MSVISLNSNGLGMKTRNGELDCLRFLFAVVIMLYHSANLFSSGGKLFMAGYLAVSFYFIVSGFFMARSVDMAEASKNYPGILGTETGQFLAHKIKLIFPYFFVSVVLGFLIKQVFAQTGGVWSNVLYALPELGFLQMAGFPVYTISGVAWYLSAMFLCMLVLYPLLRRYTNIFTFIIAPLLVVFLIGGMLRAQQHLTIPEAVFGGVVYKGVLRALAELSLGCLCYYVCQVFKRINFSKKGLWILSLAELAGYIGALRLMWKMGSGLDFLAVFLLAFSVTVTLSGRTVWNNALNGRVSSILGKLSITLFFNHFYWCLLLGKIFPDMGRAQLLWLYLGVSFLSAVLVLGLVKYLAPFGCYLKKKAKLILLAQN